MVETYPKTSASLKQLGWVIENPLKLKIKKSALNTADEHVESLIVRESNGRQAIRVLQLWFLQEGTTQLNGLKMKNIKRILAFVALVLVAIVGYFALAIFGYSAREGAIIDDNQDQVERPTIKSPTDLLSLEWDSEAPPTWPVAGLMAELCDIAYESPVGVAKTFERLGFQKWQTVVDGSMIGYVLIHDRTAVIVFRGTDNKVDWLVNLASTTSPTPNGHIHRGFSGAYRPLLPQVESVLEENSTERVWITGHSLGGALALVSAHDLLDKPVEIAGVVTFGQPAVAKHDLAGHLDQELIGKYARFVNHKDIVPRVPITFKPCGRLVWFTDKGLKRSPPKRLAYGSGQLTIQVSQSDDVEEVPMMSAEEFLQWQQKQNVSQPTRLPDGTIVYSTSVRQFDDHSIDLYRSEISRLLNQGNRRR